MGHGYLYIVYLITAGLLGLKARLYVPLREAVWILLMFAAGLVPGLTFLVEWLIVTKKIHPLLAASGAATRRNRGQPSRSMTVPLAWPPPSHIVWYP